MYTSLSIYVFYTICCLFQMSFERYVGFADGASRHTCNLALAAWVIYSPSGQLVASRGACLGSVSNNVAEYRDVIELLWDALSHGITQLEVRMDSQLVVSQLNRSYQVWNLILLHQFMQVRLLERNFEIITFNHIPRNQNSLTDAYANYILDWHLTHISYYTTYI